jgi:CheY-like chemotaxis protein
MQQYLRKLSYRVYTRADSLDALATFRADPDRFAAVITDHTMPCLEGAELAEKLAEIRPDLPVILMTGLNQPPDFDYSPHAARRAVIRKPLDFADLSRRLRLFLDQP